MSQSKILEIGDTHGEAEQVVDDILENYDTGDIDGVTFVGDATNMPGKYAREEGTSEQMSGLISQKILDENYGQFDRLGEELDVPVYSISGNHEERLGGLYEQVVDSYDNVQDISYDSVEIGDETIVGFDSHENREKPVEGFDSDEEEVGDSETENYNETESSKATPSDLVTGPVGAMGTMVGSMFGFGGSSSNQSDYDEEQENEGYEEESEVESGEEGRRKQIYEEKYDRIDQVLTEADDDAVLLHHSVPDGAELENTEMGYVNGRGYKGSVIGTEMIEEHDISTYLGGHHHGHEQEEILGADVYNPGADNYYELTIEGGDVVDSEHHDTGVWEPDYGKQIDRVLEGEHQNLPDELVERIENGEITVREAFEEMEEIIQQQTPQQPQQAPGAGQGEGPAQAGA